MILRFLGAVQFLTILPIRRQTVPPGRAAIFFPLVGAILGAAGGLLLDAVRGYVPFSLAALIVLAFWTLVTGGLHEDGVADVADAFRAWRSPEKIHEILKDSRVGAHGALALVFMMLIRWQALSMIAVEAVSALAAALALGRTTAVVLLWLTPPAGSGHAVTMSESLRSGAAVIAIAQGIAFALWPGERVASILLGGATVLIIAARGYFLRRIGGVTGDCLGATALLIETWCLIVFTCRPCTS